MYTLLGGKVRPSTTLSYSIANQDVAKDLEEIKWLIDQGFFVFKIKTGVLPLDDEVRRIEAIRRALPSSFDMRIDFNQGLERELAIKTCRALERFSPTFMEQPVKGFTGGVDTPPGETILDKRRDALERLDGVRRLLVHEPRGHADMYGCFVVEPNDEGADLGVVFFHNAGYSTACGHGTIALVTWALDEGIVARDEGETHVVVDVPSGRLDAWARVRDGRVVSVRFRNVPAFVWAEGVELGDTVGRRLRRRVLRVARGARSIRRSCRGSSSSGASSSASSRSGRTSSTPSSRSCATSTASSSGSRRERAR